MKHLFPLFYLFRLVLPGYCLARFTYFLADICAEIGKKALLRVRYLLLSVRASHTTSNGGKYETELKEVLFKSTEPIAYSDSVGTQQKCHFK